MITHLTQNSWDFDLCTIVAKLCRQDLHTFSANFWDWNADSFSHLGCMARSSYSQTASYKTTFWDVHSHKTIALDPNHYNAINATQRKSCNARIINVQSKCRLLTYLTCKAFLRPQVAIFVFVRCLNMCTSQVEKYEMGRNIFLHYMCTVWLWSTTTHKVRYWSRRADLLWA